MYKNDVAIANSKCPNQTFLLAKKSDLGSALVTQIYFRKHYMVVVFLFSCSAILSYTVTTKAGESAINKLYTYL